MHARPSPRSSGGKQTSRPRRRNPPRAGVTIGPSSCWRCSRGRPRSGSLIELCMVMVIVSILLRVGLPAYQSIVTKARAAQAIGDLNVIREASVTYYAALGSWPAESGAAVIPSGLATYLPKGYSFTRKQYNLDWENWALPSGLPSKPKTGVLLGVSVVTSDTKLGNPVL